MTSKIDEMIRRGADLAMAREQFPDIVPYSEAAKSGVSENWSYDEYMSASLAPDMVDCARQGHGDYIRLGKRFGSVVVFETDASDRVPRPYIPHADGTVSALLDRLASHPETRDAVVAALSAVTWEAFVKKSGARAR